MPARSMPGTEISDMFTGIVEAVGKVLALESRSGDLRLRIDSRALDMSDVQLGDSIATNGVCLTVVEFSAAMFVADVSLETLAHSTLRELKVGDALNLEKALCLSTRLGGHLVSGHVDGVAEVLDRHPSARSERFRLRAPQALARYIAHKGSVTIDGVSLTVNRVEGCEFELNIVPHTIARTIIAGYRAGSRVNLEVDILARYLERLMLSGRDERDTQQTPAGAGIDLATLAKHGFYKG